MQFWFLFPNFALKNDTIIPISQKGSNKRLQIKQQQQQQFGKQQAITTITESDHQQEQQE